MKNLSLILTIFIFLSGWNVSFSQESLLDQIDGEYEESAPKKSSFKALKIVNNQSTKIAKKDELYLYVAHRFGSVNGGLYTLFGLDQANTKIELIYGLKDNLQLGFSRESLNKTYNLSAKWGLFNQNDTFPFNVSLYSSFNLKTLKSNSIRSSNNKPVTPPFFENNTLLTQLLISRSFSEKLSLQISPSYVHRNKIETIHQKQSNYIINYGGRYLTSKRMSVNFDYSQYLNRKCSCPYSDVISLGVDIETGGHVFQLLFSNAQLLDDADVLMEGNKNWTKGNFYFGFNILRVF